eukprot:8204293-Alexandrium_andersonii.AAC.1
MLPGLLSPPSGRSRRETPGGPWHSWLSWRLRRWPRSATSARTWPRRCTWTTAQGSPPPSPSSGASSSAGRGLKKPAASPPIWPRPNFGGGRPEPTGRS